MKNKKIIIAIAIILVVTLICSTVGLFKNKENNSDGNKEKDNYTLVKTEDEFFKAYDAEENIRLSNDLVVVFPKYIPKNNINIDLNGYKCIFEGVIDATDYTFYITNSKGNASFDLTNLVVDYLPNLDTSKNFNIISLDNNIKILANYDTEDQTKIGDNLYIINENNKYIVTYKFVNIVSDAVKESTDLYSYLESKTDSKDFILNYPIRVTLSSFEITVNKKILIQDEGKLILAGDITFADSILDISATNPEQINISGLLLKEKNDSIDKKLIKITGVDINSIAKPRSPYKIIDDSFAYSK